jgi:hypothetical protein
MDHDQRGCLRCGKSAGEWRFCESCRSKFGLFLERPIGVAACAEEEVSIVAPVAREPAVAPKMAAGGGDRQDPGPGQNLGTRLREGALEADRISAGGDERAGQAGPPAREVARFEDVLSPAELDAELEPYRRADAAGDPEAATKLGVLLEQRGDIKGALAAYRRADRRGSVSGSFNLGCLLAEMGEVEEAKAALRRADERGDAAGASNLGVLLERQGDLDGALAAYRRADERGDAIGAFNLALLLVGRGDADGAQAAYRRAAELGVLELQELAASAVPAAAKPATAPAAEPVGGASAEPRPTVEHEVVPDDAFTPSDPRSEWVRVACVVALLGVAVLVTRRRRRSR